MSVTFFGPLLRARQQDKLYSNNPHILDELKQNIHEIITSVKVSKLKLVSHNLFRSEICLKAEGGHFEHLPQWRVFETIYLLSEMHVRVYNAWHNNRDA
jgi:hypothetical protein